MDVTAAQVPDAFAPPTIETKHQAYLLLLRGSSPGKIARVFEKNKQIEREKVNYEYYRYRSVPIAGTYHEEWIFDPTLPVETPMRVSRPVTRSMQQS